MLPIQWRKDNISAKRAMIIGHQQEKLKKSDTLGNHIPDK